MILFEHPLSPYSQKVKIALREKGLAFDLRVPEGLGSGAGYGSDFSGASPRAEVPALIDGDVRVFDSTIILEYLEEKWPEPALLSYDPVVRARERMIEDVMDTQYEPINWGLIEIRFMGRVGGPLAETLRARAGHQATALRRWLTAQLGDAPWFGGSAFGRADLSVIPNLNGSISFGIPPEPGSKLAQWVERANARSAVSQTEREASASIDGLSGIEQLIEEGLFKREYRDHRLEWMIKSGGLQVVIDGIAKDNIRFTTEF